MTLVAGSFKDYYNQLLVRYVSPQEELNRVSQEEYSLRKRIEGEVSAALADLLHIRGILLAECRQRESDRRVSTYRRPDPVTAAIMKQENAIWFPAKPPRPVTPPSRHLVPAYPYKLAAELMEEEAELRRWLVGVEARLREPIERDCADSWFLIICLNECEGLEARGRNRILKDEAEEIAESRRVFFRNAPADYYRQLVKQRFGLETKADSPVAVHKPTVEEEESEGRATITSEMLEAWAMECKWLHHMYGVQLFSANRTELDTRRDIMDEEAADLWFELREFNRQFFGNSFLYTPTVAHLVSPRQTPLLGAVAAFAYQEGKQRSERFRQRHFSARYSGASAMGTIGSMDLTLTGLMSGTTTQGNAGFGEEGAAAARKAAAEDEEAEEVLSGTRRPGEKDEFAEKIPDDAPLKVSEESVSGAAPPLAGSVYFNVLSPYRFTEGSEASESHKQLPAQSTEKRLSGQETEGESVGDRSTPGVSSEVLVPAPPPRRASSRKSPTVGDAAVSPLVAREEGAHHAEPAAEAEEAKKAESEKAESEKAETEKGEASSAGSPVVPLRAMEEGEAGAADELDESCQSRVPFVACMEETQERTAAEEVPRELSENELTQSLAIDAAPVVADEAGSATGALLEAGERAEPTEAGEAQCPAAAGEDEPLTRGEEEVNDPVHTPRPFYLHAEEGSQAGDSPSKGKEVSSRGCCR